jgi:non-heme chloroperoxidase
MDTYADDLATLIETLDLKDALLIGFSAGGGEVAAISAATKRLAKAELISAVPTLMLKTESNPGGLPTEVFDDLHAGFLADRSQLYKDLAAGPFFGANRRDAKVRQGMIDSLRHQGMQAGHKNTFDCIKAFSETDFTEDLKKFNVPTLILHGDDDQIGAAALRSSKLIKNATLKIYTGAPHGLAYTHKDQLNADLLAFLKTGGRFAVAACRRRRYWGPYRSAIQQGYPLIARNGLLRRYRSTSSFFLTEGFTSGVDSE